MERTATLTERQRQLAQAQEIAHLGSWRWDAESGDVTWSDELYRVFGAEQGSIRKFQDVMTAVHEKARQARREVLDRTLVVNTRSDARRVRKVCVCTSRSRWPPQRKKKTKRYT